MEIAAGRAGSVFPKLKGTLSRYYFFFFWYAFASSTEGRSIYKTKGIRLGCLRGA